MTTKKIYGPWIKWNGGECPVPPEAIVEAKLRCVGVEISGLAKTYSWLGVGGDGDIVEYCVVLEQADLDAAEQLLSANGYTIIPPAKPLTFEDVEPMTEAPPEGAWYWMVQPFTEDGVDSFCWDDDEADQYALRRRVAYLEKEHALIAARHIFGLKGGEL